MNTLLDDRIETESKQDLIMMNPANKSTRTTLSKGLRDLEKYSDQNRWVSHLIGFGIFLSLVAFFVLWGGSRLDIGRQEARLGMAARETFGPVGQSFGGLDPGIYPGPIAIIKAWGLMEKHGPGQEAIRWTTAICASLIGIALTLRSEWLCGKVAAISVALCWLSNLALINRSGEFGLDFYTGLGLVLALNETVAKKGMLTWKAGIFTGISFLCAGLAPVILVLVNSIVICRSSAGLRPAFLAIVIATVGAWSAWALNTISAEAWAAAIALPMAVRSGSSFPTIALCLCFPMILAVPAFFSQTLREKWSEERREYVSNWWTISALCLFIGTILPQFSRSTLIPVIAGFSVVAGHVWATAWADQKFKLLGSAGRWLAMSSGFMVIVLTIIAIPMGTFVSMAIPYYRWTALLWVCLTGLSSILYVNGVLKGEARRVIVALLVMLVSIKTAHVSIYVPEWNYRRSQGPWGRAVGQWVPGGWPIYTLHGWQTDFAFATGHNFRQITAPRFLPDMDQSPNGRPNFILLHPADYERWPKFAPPIQKVAEFQDNSGRGTARILARTGPEQVNWRNWLYKRPIQQPESVSE
ncbi:MAG: hypothetical protein RJA81_586 [Planctomycetota bacterium]|jgi:hypothetical protein